MQKSQNVIQMSHIQYSNKGAKEESFAWLYCHSFLWKSEVEPIFPPGEKDS